MMLFVKGNWLIVNQYMTHPTAYLVYLPGKVQGGKAMAFRKW